MRPAFHSHRVDLFETAQGDRGELLVLCAACVGTSGVCQRLFTSSAHFPPYPSPQVHSYRRRTFAAALIMSSAIASPKKEASVMSEPPSFPDGPGRASPVLALPRLRMSVSDTPGVLCRPLLLPSISNQLNMEDASKNTLSNKTWQTSLTEEEREVVRLKIMAAYKRQAKTYEDVLNVAAALQEEECFGRAPSRLDYIKDTVQFSHRLGETKKKLVSGRGKGSGAEKQAEVKEKELTHSDTGGTRKGGRSEAVKISIVSDKQVMEGHGAGEGENSKKQRAEKGQTRGREQVPCTRLEGRRNTSAKFTKNAAGCREKISEQPKEKK